MKKVIFISALAIAAAVSCTKSDIVDTKFGNEQIGFESYIGRAAQTKATPTESVTTAGIYGFYMGATGTWTGSNEANLWDNDILTNTNGVGTVNPVRYWTNANDKYSFVAYAPYAANGTLKKTIGEEEFTLISAPMNTADVMVTDPKITYTVPQTLSDQEDLIYANALDKQKPTGNDNIDLLFKHALARLTVKASVNNTTPFEYHIKEVSINGPFIVSDDLTLSTGKWGKEGKASTDNTKYTFYTNGAKANQTGAVALTQGGVDYSGTTVEGTTTKYGNNYLMMIPVDFTANKAVLTVKYSTYYREGDLESDTYTKTFDVTTNFEAGNAYAIDLKFIQDSSEIKFDVSVTPWVDAGTQTVDQAN